MWLVNESLIEAVGGDDISHWAIYEVGAIPASTITDINIWKMFHNISQICFLKKSLCAK